MKIAVAGFWHETHTFATTRTTLDDFERFEFVEGAAMISLFQGTRTSVGGYIDGAQQFGLELAPVFYAGAMPSGLVTADTYADLERLLHGLRKIGPIDGLLAPLHGAMVVEGIDDMEGRLLRQMREIIGQQCPLVATLDFHANISALMVESADMVIGYDTYPHVDIYERGVEACRVMRALIDEKIKPTAALVKPPLLLAPQFQYTDRPPMSGLIALAHQFERESGILSVTVAAGYPYSDLERVGMGIVVTTDNNPELAADKARMLADFAWDHRRAFLIPNIPVAEAVTRAIAAPTGPVILVDSADNIGGGAPGDGTAALAELLNQRAREVVIVVADAESVSQAIVAGIGNEISLSVGGKTDSLHGAPVDLRGRVRLISDGRYRNKGSYMTGREVCMGQTVVLDVDGLTLVLTEFKTMPFDAQQLRSIGIEPADQRILVVKSAIAWRAAYGDIAAQVIEMDTPGICSVHLENFAYTKIRRPMFPLDDLAE